MNGKTFNTGVFEIVVADIVEIATNPVMGLVRKAIEICKSIIASPLVMVGGFNLLSRRDKNEEYDYFLKSAFETNGEVESTIRLTVSGVIYEGKKNKNETREEAYMRLISEAYNNLCMIQTEQERIMRVMNGEPPIPPILVRSEVDQIFAGMGINPLVQTIMERGMKDEFLTLLKKENEKIERDKRHLENLLGKFSGQYYKKITEGRKKLMGVKQ